MTKRQQIQTLSGLMFQLMLGGLSYWFVRVICGLDVFLGLVVFATVLVLSKIILILLESVLSHSYTPIIYNDREREEENDSMQSLTEEALLDNKREKKDYAKPIVRDIVAYTSLTLGGFFCTEDIAVIQKSILLFKSCASNVVAIERPLSDMNGLTTKDLYHYGWNVGRRMDKSRDEIAWFLRHTFPLVFANTDHSTIVKKMTSNDGAYSIRCIPISEPLLEVNV